MLYLLISSVIGIVVNECDYENPCGDGSCCSQYGWCGVTADYCESGCQSNCNSNSGLLENECNLENQCEDGSCCSQYGWCGVTADYCEYGCQSNCVGTTSTTSTTSTTTSVNPVITNSYPITDTNYCGPEALTRCPSTGNVCCADNGVCGETVKECGIVRYACRPEFGECGGPAPMSFTIPIISDSNKAYLIKDCVKPGMFALTYDDGVFDYTNILLKILRSNDVKATFFINAYNWGDITVDPYKSYLRSLYVENHHIASHGYNHYDFTTLTDELLWNEMYRNDYAIKSVLGVSPIYMRPPFGSVNNHVMSALGSWGYKVIWQNIDSRDVFNDGDIQLNLNSFSILNESSSTLNSFISLQHDTISGTVLNWTQTVIDLVKSLNYTLVTVGECRGERDPVKWYK